MNYKIWSLILLCIALLVVIFCLVFKDRDQIPFVYMENTARGLKSDSFFITEVSKYKGCELFLYHDQKAESVIKLDLDQWGNQICVTLPNPPEKGTIVFAGKSITTNLPFSFDESIRDSGYMSPYPKNPIPAAPTLNLLGTLFSSNPKPADFHDEEWCFVLKFE